MIDTYYIELRGCDALTVFTMELDDKEVELLQRVSQKSQEVSTYVCMPEIFIKPLKDCNQYELEEVGIISNDLK